MFTGPHAEEILAANPSFQLQVIEGAGHSVHRDRPEETIQALEAFLH